jgi:hypothetical protein
MYVFIIVEERNPINPFKKGRGKGSNDDQTGGSNFGKQIGR